MHTDLRILEDCVDACKEARKWLDYHGTQCEGRPGHVSMVRVDRVEAVMTVPSGWSQRCRPTAIYDLLKELLTERWPELSLALQAKIDVKEAEARKSIVEIANKLAEENK